MTNGLVNVHLRFGIYSNTFIHILVYSLAPETDNPVGSKLFQKHKFVHLPIPSMFDLINEIFTIPMHGQPKLTLL